jgi:hypothetical protein
MPLFKQYNISDFFQDIVDKDLKLKNYLSNLKDFIMPKIFTTPCAKAKQGKFNFLRWNFRAESLDKPIALCEQIRLGRQSRLKVQTALAQQTFGETSTLKLNNSIAFPISEILEGISQNISKMDQNLYSAKANMEEILRTSSNDNEFVSLD